MELEQIEKEAEDTNLYAAVIQLSIDPKMDAEDISFEGKLIIHTLIQIAKNLDGISNCLNKLTKLLEDK